MNRRQRRQAARARHPSALRDVVERMVGQPPPGGHRVLVTDDGSLLLLAHGHEWTGPLHVLDGPEPPPCPGCTGTIADQP